MQGPCTECHNLTSTVVVLPKGARRYLCSDSCRRAYVHARTPPVEIATWMSGSQHSEMVQVGDELRVKWCNDSCNRRIVFNLSDLRADDVRVLSRVVADAREASRWRPPAPGTTPCGPERSAKLYPLDGVSKFLDTIEEMVLH